VCSLHALLPLVPCMLSTHTISVPSRMAMRESKSASRNRVSVSPTKSMVYEWLAPSKCFAEGQQRIDVAYICRQLSTEPLGRMAVSRESSSEPRRIRARTRHRTPRLRSSARVAVAHFGAILDVAITIQVIVHRAPSLEQPIVTCVKASMRRDAMLFHEIRGH